MYRVVRMLGQGGMGEVYEVEHDLLGTRRALKVLARQLAGRDDLAERLRVEARGLARLRHPNLVEVYDLQFASDGRMFFVMELLQGMTLRELLRGRRRLEPAHAVRIMGQVLDGLHAAHQSQLVHRDIKPENIFVCGGELIKLLDFGVAKAIDAWLPTQQLTAAGMTVGTPRYMAPEQAEGKAVDARCDLYSTGLVLWEALAGRPAFDDPDPVVVAMARLTRGVASLGAAAPGIPAALARAVMQACARHAPDRQPSAAIFAQQLRGAVGEVEPAAARAIGAHLPSGVDCTPARTDPGEVATRPDRAAAPARAGARTDPAPAPLHSDAAADTVVDQVPLEPTQRLEVWDVDREAPTSAGIQQETRPIGPTGTEMLPAIAAQHCPTVISQPMGSASAAATGPTSTGQGVVIVPVPRSPRRLAAMVTVVAVMFIAALIGALAIRARSRESIPVASVASTVAQPLAPASEAAAGPAPPSASSALQVPEPPVRSGPAPVPSPVVPRPKPTPASSAMPGSGL